MLQTEQPGRHMKSSAEIFWAAKKGKITVKLCGKKFHLTVLWGVTYH